MTIGQSGSYLEEKQKPILFTIPVVVHVLYNDKFNNLTDVQIESAILMLKNDFQFKNENADECPEQWKYLQANCQIDFCLDSITRKDVDSTIFRKPKYSIISGGRNPILSLGGDEAKFTSKGGVDAWNATKYLNIWIVPKFNRIIGDNDDEKTQGYAQLPGGPIETDGVVVLSDFFGDGHRTATHEVGHWLNLRHIWTNLCILGLGDDVDDTPIQNSSYLNIPWCDKKEAPPSTCPQQSISSKLPKGDMPTNFMTLAPDRCMNMFTLGQKQRIHELFKPGGYRYSLQFSDGCSKPQEPGENTNKPSKDPNCKENQNGDYFFQNNTKSELQVNITSSPEKKSNLGQQFSCTLYPGQNQCFYNVPAGSAEYDISSFSGSNYYYGNGMIYIDTCKNNTFFINEGLPSYSTNQPSETDLNSKNSNCKEDNTGDYCFKNSTKSELRVNITSSSKRNSGLSYQFSLKLQPAQSQCFYNVPAGSLEYTVSSYSGFENYYTNGQLYMDKCKTIFFNIK